MSAAAPFFQPGERIAIREVLRGKTWTSRPVVVVQHDREQFVSYLAPGTIIDYPITVEHGRSTFSMWLSGEWMLGPKEFHAPGFLRIAPAGQPFEVFAALTAEEGVSSWYVNFQQPLQRSSLGFDTMDETLDLVVSADFSSWERKDSDELELAVAMGVYDEHAAERISAACRAVETQLEAGVIPWDRRWADWRPPATVSARP